MTNPLWVSVAVALIAGLFAAIVAPLVTASLSRRNWRSQKLFELKFDIFRGATAALASYLTDALDPGLQKAKAEWKGMSRHVEARPETWQALEQYRGLVAAFFSAEVSQKYDQATRANVSLDNIPNSDFEANRLAFIEASSAELGLTNPCFSWKLGLSAAKARLSRRIGIPFTRSGRQRKLGAFVSRLLFGWLRK